MAIINNNLIPEGKISQEEYKSIFEHFVNYLKSILQSKGKKSNNYFVDLGKTAEEKQAIQDGCEDIDNYYSELAEAATSALSTGDYFIKRLTEIEREDGDSLLTDEQIKELTNEYLDRESEEQANQLFDFENIDIKTEDNGNREDKL